MIETPPTAVGNDRDARQDISPARDVRVLMNAIAAGTRVERTALIDALDRMLRLVVRTDADFDDLVLLVQRTTPLELDVDADVKEVHVLPDGSTIIHTTWSMSTKRIVAASLDEGNVLLLSEHDDERGVPCFRGAQVTIASAARSYEDAVDLLGEGVTFLLPPSLTDTHGD